MPGGGGPPMDPAKNIGFAAMAAAMPGGMDGGSPGGGGGPADIAAAMAAACAGDIELAANAAIISGGMFGNGGKPACPGGILSMAHGVGPGGPPGPQGDIWS
mmetsp:Transcript_13938/g.39471  ORF Transcript_13938/g.39471 Transcript_13938/m.39471 type:complete len:102 (-) Transcript_13938:2172-2477(-)